MSESFNQAVERKILAIGKAPAGTVVSGEPSSTGLILKHEKFSKTPYADFKQTSIGYGTKAKKGETSIDEAEAKRRAIEQIKKEREIIDKARKDWGYDWTPKQVDALTSFRYNIGNIGELTANGTRSDKEIADALLLYDKVKDKGQVKALKALSDRRMEERNLFLEGMRDREGVKVVRGGEPVAKPMAKPPKQ